MATSSPKDVTQLLIARSQGNQAALDKLMPLVYDELHRMAKRYMGRQPPGHTLQTTALIHGAYLRLVGQPARQWKNRAHFFVVTTQAMRHVLVDYARARGYKKRGGGALVVSLDEAAVVFQERAAEVIALDEALTNLAALYPRQSQVSGDRSRKQKSQLPSLRVTSKGT